MNIDLFESIFKQALEETIKQLGKDSFIMFMNGYK